MGTLAREHIEELVREKKISPKEMLKLIQYISDPWEQARGLLKQKKISAVACQRKLRKEWNR
jgi:hypothetical protein